MSFGSTFFASHPPFIDQPRWIREGKVIAIDPSGYVVLADPVLENVRKISLAGLRSVMTVAAELPYDAAQKSDYTYFIARNSNDLTEGPIAVDLMTQKIRFAHLMHQAIAVFSGGPYCQMTSDKNWMFYPSSSSDIPPAIIAETPQGERRSIAHLNPEYDNEVFGKSKLLSYTRRDGVKLRAALLLPSRYIAGRRYPLAVWIYGGSMGSTFVDEFGMIPFNAQMLATRGFAVLYPDEPYREGQGYITQDLLDDTIAGVDAVTRAGIADPNKLFLFGHSFGGYSTLAVIEKTQRFKAAAAANGIYDLSFGYGQMEGDDFLGLQQETSNMGGDPWRERTNYSRDDPYRHLDMVRTPLLILEGTGDTDIPSLQSDALFVGLSVLGHPVRYVRYANEDHIPSGWSAADYSNWWEEIIAWFVQRR